MCPCVLHTPVTIIQIGKRLPLVVLHETDERALDVRTHLQHKLVESVGREAWRDERHVERLAERCDGVHRLLVVEPKNGIHPAGKLRADCR